jgi:hypothetical protein
MFAGSNEDAKKSAIYVHGEPFHADSSHPFKQQQTLIDHIEEMSVFMLI